MKCSLLIVVVHKTNCILVCLSACQIQSVLEETLQAVGAKAMVVGHTPQTSGVNWYGILI